MSSDRFQSSGENKKSDDIGYFIEPEAEKVLKDRCEWFGNADKISKRIFREIYDKIQVTNIKRILMMIGKFGFHLTLFTPQRVKKPLRNCQ